MRDLKYQVDQQIVKATNDVSNVYKGVENYLNLVFTFDKNWEDCMKAVVFVVNGEEIPKLLKDDQCVIPKEACQGDYIWFYLVGKKKDYRLQTQKVHIELR